MLGYQLIDGRQQVFQWETDRYIRLIGFSSCDHVSFFNPDGSEAYKVSPETHDDDTVVMIPNECLQSDRKVRFYAVGNDEYGQYVQLDGVINLVPRQRPAEYAYVPTEIRTFDEILSKAEGYAESASQSAVDAKASAASAAESASRLGTEAEEAERWAGIAEEAGKSASDSAEAAQEAARQAELVHENVEGRIIGGYDCILGDGVSTSFTVTHSLGTKKLIVQPWSRIDGAGVPAYSIRIIDESSMSISFSTPPAADGIALYISDIRTRTEQGLEIQPEQLSESCFLSREDALRILNS